LRERDYQVYEDRVRAIVLIHVEQAEPMTSPAYDVGQTEAQLVEHYLDYYVGLHRSPQRMTLHVAECDRNPCT